jgi:hypothetical protein
VPLLKRAGSTIANCNGVGYAPILLHAGSRYYCCIHKAASRAANPVGGKSHPEAPRCVEVMASMHIPHDLHGWPKRYCAACSHSAGEAELRSLDSSVKRNGALTKKVRAVSEETISSLLKECASVNQAKVGWQEEEGMGTPA